MKRCLRIIVTANFPVNFLEAFIQKQARKLGLEGTAQLVDVDKQKLRISICGPGDQLDDFVDLFHKEAAKFELYDMEIEPFLKEKDYRNVFRVIE